MKKLLQIIGAVTLVLILGVVCLGGYLYLKNKNRFSISSNSMAPTFKATDVVEGDRHAYENSTPRVGDVVTYRKGEDGYTYIGRVVGVPGDTISFPSGKLNVNGKPVQLETRVVSNSEGLDEVVEKLGETEYTALYLHDRAGLYLFEDSVTLKDDQYFIAGDNRDNAKDSRFDGPVSKTQFVARLKQIVESQDKERVGRSL